MNEFCAAMGLCNLKHVDEEIEKRAAVAGVYRKLLEGAEGITLNTVQDGVKPNYAYFPVVLDEKRFGASRNEVFYCKPLESELKLKLVLAQGAAGELEEVLA